MGNLQFLRGLRAAFFFAWRKMQAPKERCRAKPGIDVTHHTSTVQSQARADFGAGSKADNTMVTSALTARAITPM